MFCVCARVLSDFSFILIFSHCVCVSVPLIEIALCIYITSENKISAEQMSDYEKSEHEQTVHSKVKRKSPTKSKTSFSFVRKKMHRQFDYRLTKTIHARSAHTHIYLQWQMLYHKRKSFQTMPLLSLNIHS